VRLFSFAQVDTFIANSKKLRRRADVKGGEEQRLVQMIRL
jgi:hypothetical protein